MTLNTEARRHKVFVFLSIAHRVIFPSPVQRSRELRVSPTIFPTGNNGTLRFRVSAFKKTL